MEGSTVSPPPASPTEEVDLCEVDVSSVAIHSVTLLTCLCGLPGNGAVLWLVRFRIHRNRITTSVLFLAFTDFLFLLTVVPSTIIFLLEDVSCSAVMPLNYLRLLFLLSLFYYITGLFMLTFISIQRSRSIFCPPWCPSRCPQRLPHGVVTALVWVYTITVGAVTVTVASLCLFHERGHCRGALISMNALSLFLCVPSMLISRTIVLIKVKRGSQQQQSQRLDIVIILAVLFVLPLILCSFLEQLGYILVSSQAVFLLTCINSSIKPFIYFLVGSSWRNCSMGRCWRHCSMKSLRKSLRRVFKEPEGNTPSNNDAAMDTVI